MLKMKKKIEKEIILEELLEAGCHFGHQAKRWQPKMKKYIWTVREGVHIFDLAKTKKCLEKAIEFVKEITAQGKKIIFVGTKRQARSIIKEAAQNCGMPYVAERWLGGTITNWRQIKKSIDKLIEMKKKREESEYDKYTKKERILIDREVSRLEKFFGGLVDLKDLPEAVFIVDCRKEEAAVKEAQMKGIKLVGLVDTNTDPTGIDYPIPANDDSAGSIRLIVGKIADAVIEGKKKLK